MQTDGENKQTSKTKAEITSPQKKKQLKMFHKKKITFVFQGQNESYFRYSTVYQVESIDRHGQIRFKSQNSRPS